MPTFVCSVVVCIYFSSKCLFFFFLKDNDGTTVTGRFAVFDMHWSSLCSREMIWILLEFFDIIIAHWLLAVVCVRFFFLFFFSLLSESTVLDGRFCRWQGTPWHGDSPYATCTLLNAKESKGCETYSFWFKFQREVFVCVRACVFEMFPCVCVCKLKRYAWNRVEDNCPFPLRSYSLILLKPATEMWLFAFWDNIYTICVFSHMYLLATYCVSAYR